MAAPLIRRSEWRKVTVRLGCRRAHRKSRCDKRHDGSGKISRQGEMLGALLIAGGVSAFVGCTVLFNTRGRKAERAVAQARGTQSAPSFAEMFPTDAEQDVARALYPRL